MKKRFVIALLAASIMLTCVLPGAALAKDKVTISLYWILSNKNMMWQAFSKMMDNVEKRTNGEVVFKRYHSGTLGTDTDAMEQMRSGALDILACGVGVYGRYDPTVASVSLPYLFRDYDHIKKFLKKDTFNKLLKGLEAHNMRAISLFNAGFRDVMNTKRAVNSAADVAGLKLKSAKIASWLTYWKTVGAMPTAIKPTEQYMAVKTGVVDGMEMAAINAKSWKLYEVCKYYSRVKAAWGGPLLAMNLAKFNSLSPEHRKILLEEASKAADWSFDQGKERDAASLKFMASKGMQINYNPDVASFRAAAQKAYAEYAKEKWFKADLIKEIQAIK